MASDYPWEDLSGGLRKIFTKRPIMAGEDPDNYDLLRELVRRDVRPRDLREWLLMKDIVDAEWELLRLRGLKVGMLHAILPNTIQAKVCDALQSLDPKFTRQIRTHVVGMLAGVPEAEQDVEKVLAAEGLTLEVTMASAFKSTIAAQAHTERMTAAAYDRRNKAYAEVERIRGKQARPRNFDEAAVEAPPTVPGNGGGPSGDENQTASGASGSGGRRSQ